MRAIIIYTIIALTFLSSWWTTVKSRGILRKSLGRKLRKSEETSLRSWMEVSDDNLDLARTELAKDPFHKILNLFQRLRFWNGRFGTPPEERPTSRP